FPMTLSIYAVLAAALAAHPGWLARWAAVAGACVALALALDPSTRRAPPGFAGAEAWLLENLEPGDAYAIDSRSLLRPSWFLPAWAKQVMVSSSWRSEERRVGKECRWGG